MPASGPTRPLTKSKYALSSSRVVTVIIHVELDPAVATMADRGDLLSRRYPGCFWSLPFAPKYLIFLARPERFERPTLRFVV